MNRFSFYLLLMYVHAGHWVQEHSPLILTLGLIAALIIAGFFLRGHRSRRASDATVIQFPSNVLDVYPTGDAPPPVSPYSTNGTLP